MTKKKEVKKDDDYVIIDRAGLEKYTKIVRTKFPKEYEVTGVFKLGHVIVEDTDGMHVAEISLNDEHMRAIFDN